MGWTYLDRRDEPVTDPRAFLDAQYGGADVVLRSEMVGSVYYAAARLKDGRVLAVVTLTDRAGGGYGFGWKTMDETFGPYATECPAAILDLLTDPPSNDWAAQWRDKCRLRLLEVAA